MNVFFDCYPGGKRKALTMSYDDGNDYDRRLVEIFNKYGIKGTFHLNSRNFDRPGYVTTAEIPTLYAGHEVSSHMLTHPWPDRIPAGQAIYEILEDRKRLESACGYVVRGMSYPFGKHNRAFEDLARTLGIEYSRTVASHHSFDLPDDFLLWNPTCHHSEHIIDRLDDFAKAGAPLALFYIWGHGFEFPRVEGAWDDMDKFCSLASQMTDVWFATNIEICDYLHACRALRLSADRTIAYNPTATDVWVRADDKPILVPAGKTVKFDA